MPRSKLALTVTLALVVAVGTPVNRALSASTDREPDVQIRNYFDIGRIRWTLPVGKYFYFAVPHFTAGPRIKCGNAAQAECEIQVSTRDFTVDADKRREQLREALKPYYADAVETSPSIETYGQARQVEYILLTHKKDGGKVATGHLVSGPFVIKFHFVARDPDGARLERVLRLVGSAVAVDSDAFLAFKLADFKAACDELYPPSRQMNEVALSSSRFAKIDYVKVIADLAPADKREETAAKIRSARQSWIEVVRKWPQETTTSFCLAYPTQVRNAED